MSVSGGRSAWSIRASGGTQGDTADGEAGGAAPRLGHEPALDGVRGVATAAILVYHGASLNGLDRLHELTRGTFLSLSGFFTLSGFLICSLLLREHASTGGVSLGSFWARRLRRLLPAAYLLFAGVIVLTPLLGTNGQLDKLPSQVWASLAYVVNWLFIHQGTDYAAQFADAPSPLQHVWSLSVEEQWYMFVPLAAIVAIHLRRRRVGRGSTHNGTNQLAVALGLAAVAGTAWMVVVSGGEYTNRAYMGTDTRLAEMVTGAAAAALLARGFEAPARVRRWLVRLAPLAMLAILAMWLLTSVRSAWVYRGGFTLHALLVSLVIVAAVQRGGFARRFLSIGAFTALGRMSYGVYLFHWPLMLWLSPARLGVPGIVAFGVQLACTAALAILSFHLVETPIRRGHRLPGLRGLTVAMSSVLVIAVGALVMPDADTSQMLALGDTPDLVVPTTPSAAVAAETTVPRDPGSVRPDATTTTTTLPPPPLKVMVIGDSFAESVVVGLQKWALTTGTMAVMNQSVPGCPFGRGGKSRALNAERPVSEKCAERDATLDATVAEFDPDVVVLAGGFWDVTDRKPGGFSRWTRVGRPAYDEFLVKEFQNMADRTAAAGARLLWLDSPYWDPVPGSAIFMGKPPYTEAETDRVDRYNELLAFAVGARPDTRIVGLHAWLQSLPEGEFNKGLRPDGVHFSQDSTLIAADWLGRLILEDAGRPIA